MEEFTSLADFLENERFRTWLKVPDEEGTLYWSNWLKNNPSKKPLFEHAVASYLALEGDSIRITDSIIAKRIQKLKENLPSAPQVWVRPWWQQPVVSWAAVLIAGLFVGGLLWQGPDRPSSSTSHVTNSAGSYPARHHVVVHNAESRSILINLPDGSSVLLTKNSKLAYNDDQALFNRRVKLTGEAFFEIVKMPDQPFFVHTTSFTTKVLGTSFLVRSFEDEARATIKVKTGKVEVIPTSKNPVNWKGTSSKDSFKSDGTMLLHPDEQAVLNRRTQEMTLETKISDEPGDKSEPIYSENFEFRFTPVNEVFDLLEKTYGTRILYDKEKFKNCTLTASLTDEPFLEKLRMICFGIEANFEISGKEIMISGPGCK